MVEATGDSLGGRFSSSELWHTGTENEEQRRKKNEGLIILPDGGRIHDMPATVVPRPEHDKVDSGVQLDGGVREGRDGGQ